MGAFSRSAPPSATTECLPPPCQQRVHDDDRLVKAVAQRVQSLTGTPIQTEGKLPLDDQDGGPMLMSPDTPPCQREAYRMDVSVRRFNRYRTALPYARAAADMNDLGDASDSEKKRAARQQQCLEMLPDSGDELCKALGLKQGTIKDTDLRNDRTGFRAAVYRSQPGNQLILVARDTQPQSLVDWKTNTDNGSGADSDQYQAMRSLSGILAKKGVSFDLAGYSKGGGLAQEGGLTSTASKVFLFNSAGLNDASLARTGATSFADLESRTRSFSAEGDFLTYMNETTDPERQIANARFLRTELAGEGAGVDPIEIQYRNPATKRAQDNKGWLDPDPDPDFGAARDQYLGEMDRLIENAETKRQAGQAFRLFPPARSGQHDTIVGSSTFWGDRFGAHDDNANLGRLIQHKMSNVLGPMEASVAADRDKLSKFLDACG